MNLRVIWVALLTVFCATGCILVPPHIPRRAAIEFSCAREQVSCAGIDPQTFRCTGCGMAATYVSDHGTLRREYEPNRVEASVPARTESGNAAAIGSTTTTAAPAGGGLSREEVQRVLVSIAPEVRSCLLRDESAQATTIQLQINGDGSAIYQGTEPVVEAESSGCLRTLVNSLRFRATGRDPFIVTTPAYPTDASVTLPSPATAPEPPSEYVQLMRSAFRELIPSLQQCCEGQPSAPASISLRIRVQPSGALILLFTEPVPPAAVGSCLRSVINTATFPPPPSARARTITPTFRIHQ